MSVDETASGHTQNSSNNIAGVLTGQEYSRGTKLLRLPWALNGDCLPKVCNLQLHQQANAATECLTPDGSAVCMCMMYHR